jgi:hypothetical protein
LLFENVLYEAGELIVDVFSNSGIESLLAAVEHRTTLEVGSLEGKA